MINVVIADDDYSVRRGLKNHIPWNELGAEVVLLASNGAEVLKLLEDTEVDLIISDIRMPVMDGLELLRYISEKEQGINMVLLSAYADFEYAQEAISLGVREYIIKPITRDKLNKLEKLVRQISVEKSIKKNMMLSLCDSKFKSDFISAVKQRDEEKLKSFLLFDKSFSNIILYKEYCVTLINLLTDISDDEKTDFLSLLQMSSGISECYELLLDKLLEPDSIAEASGSMQTVKKIISYVNENRFDSRINVQGVANHFGLTPEYVSTLFKAENGSALSDWIITCRISKAIEMLTNTRLKVYQISKAVGYEDVRYFMRLFKKRIGMTPTQYRNKAGNTERIQK